MCKKVVIAALAVVVGLAVVKGTWIGSHARLFVKKSGAWAKKQVTPEQEIARLEMELKNLENNDKQHYHDVAELDTQTKRFAKEVARVKDNLTKEKNRVAKLADELNSGKEFVMSGESQYTKSDLGADVIRLNGCEENCKSMEEDLKLRQAHVAEEVRKLHTIRGAREKMTADLRKLKVRLAEERRHQAATRSTINRSDLATWEKDLEAVSDSLDTMKTARELRGEVRISPAEDMAKKEAKQREEAADKFLAERKKSTKDSE